MHYFPFKSVFAVACLCHINRILGREGCFCVCSKTAHSLILRYLHWSPKLSCQVTGDVWSLMNSKACFIRAFKDTSEAVKWSHVLSSVISLPVGQTPWLLHGFYWKADISTVINSSNTGLDGPAGGSFGKRDAYKVHSHLSPAELRVNAGATNTHPWYFAVISETHIILWGVL